MRYTCTAYGNELSVFKGRKLTLHCNSPTGLLYRLTVWEPYCLRPPTTLSLRYKTASLHCSNALPPHPLPYEKKWWRLNLKGPTICPNKMSIFFPPKMVYFRWNTFLFEEKPIKVTRYRIRRAKAKRWNEDESTGNDKLTPTPRGDLLPGHRNDSVKAKWFIALIS